MFEGLMASSVLASSAVWAGVLVGLVLGLVLGWGLWSDPPSAECAWCNYMNHRDLDSEDDDWPDAFA